MKTTGLYIHVPFCLSKCPYCDFYSVRYESGLAQAYKNAVIRNLLYYGGSYDTVYFGGGTPILLWREICEILENISLAEKAEITIESNPCCTDTERLSALKAVGINRISFGVQSLDDNELKALGRRHNADTAVKALLLAEKCGFENISADIMLGTPNQSLQTVTNTVSSLSKLPVTHISAYMLKIEPNTPFSKQDLKLPDEDMTCDIYLSTVKKLEQLGFMQYEISNFAKKGYECKHNLKYWNCEEYLGIGPAAHSFYDGIRFFTKRDLKGFADSYVQSVKIEDEHPAGYEEYAMLRLRLKEGLSFDLFRKKGGDVRAMLKNAETVPKNLISVNENSISITSEGFTVSNAIIGRLLGY